MTDNNFYEDGDFTSEELRILAADGEERVSIKDGQVTADVITVDSISEDTLVADEVTEDTTPAAKPAEKPEFDLKRIAAYGVEGYYLASKSEGPVVAYVNNKFGIEGDRYTPETREAVLAFQTENKIRRTGRVDRETYNAL